MDYSNKKILVLINVLENMLNLKVEMYVVQNVNIILKMMDINIVILFVMENINIMFQIQQENIVYRIVQLNKFII